jgi:hypothetical protein
MPRYFYIIVLPIIFIAIWAYAIATLPAIIDLPATIILLFAWGSFKHGMELPYKLARLEQAQSQPAPVSKPEPKSESIQPEPPPEVQAQPEPHEYGIYVGDDE